MGVLHLLWLPFGMRERACEVDGRFGAWQSILDSMRSHGWGVWARWASGVVADRIAKKLVVGESRCCEKRRTGQELLRVGRSRSSHFKLTARSGCGCYFFLLLISAHEPELDNSLQQCNFESATGFPDTIYCPEKMIVLQLWPHFQSIPTI